MTTITIKIDDQSSKGKVLKEFLNEFVKNDNAIQVIEEESSYDPAFVKMVKKSVASKKRYTIDTNDVWGSLKLK